MQSALAIKVRELLSEEAAPLQLRLIAGKRGLKREITVPRIQKPGLALLGDIEYLRSGRIQILGASEINYLEKLSTSERSRVLHKICSYGVACFIVTKELKPPIELVEQANRFDIALLQTPLVSSVCIDKVTDFLDNRLAPRTSLHGDLMDVYGIGVLIIGESGIGKSECALDLIVRGHRLVADDMIEIKRRAGNILMGSGPELIRHQMELRGLGLISIKDLFGVASIRYEKMVDLVVLLERWDEEQKYDRLGIDEKQYEILGVKVPLIRMPVAPGRNISILIEVAARNHLLKLKGYHAARDFVDRYDKKVRLNPFIKDFRSDDGKQ
ncbi:HPr(Ser) kinase/phosphatase [bacterium (candidate division B38) B3_B38]|nr:MAG: HPr(Ser) kinase/phosphatase [bacterium (candidate division B38) B3_B38]